MQQSEVESGRKAWQKSGGSELPVCRKKKEIGSEWKTGIALGIDWRKKRPSEPSEPCRFRKIGMPSNSEVISEFQSGIGTFRCSSAPTR